MNHQYFCRYRKAIQKAHILSSSSTIELAQGNCAQYVVRTYISNAMAETKVIREKSRGEGSLIEQDTIENVSEPNIFF